MRGLAEEKVPRWEPGPSDVLVRLCVSGVNVSDVKARSGARADGGGIAAKAALVSGGGTVGYQAVQVAAAGGAHAIATMSDETSIARTEEAGAHHLAGLRAV